MLDHATGMLQIMLETMPQHVRGKIESKFELGSSLKLHGTVGIGAATS
jgi:hypothetical protein